jgi:hypothetical protein
MLSSYETNETDEEIHKSFVISTVMRIGIRALTPGAFLLMVIEA